MDIVRALTDSLPSPPVVPTVEKPLAWLESSHTYQRGSIIIVNLIIIMESIVENNKVSLGFYMLEPLRSSK
jgi:hypothetical protein